MSKKLLFLFVFFVFVFIHINYFEININSNDYQENSLIGLTINGSSTTNFPNKDSGYAIDSIRCDKDATGVWDYENWGLKVRGVHQSRTKCQINFVSRYSENILNGTDPVLKDGLIPVIIDNDGTVRKTSLGWEWYDYETQRWANAVILNNESEVYYDGDIIPEDNIESYFVWIPRYKYQIFNEQVGNYTGKDGVSTDYGLSKQIQVIFETKDVAKSNGSTYNSWLTHPAFTSFNTNGIWVGKFETGYKGATTTSEAEHNENSPNKVQVKPNVYSWRGIQVANAHLSSYNYKREYDSHMMKNTEWGAVAYLQHSKYGSGKYAGTSESAKASVRINNNASYMTGYAAKKEPTCGYTATNEECNKYENIDTLGKDGTYTVNYFNSASQVASTTGNYSGVYDMSGGAWEYVMGVMLSTTGIPCSGRDATGEMGPFIDRTYGSLVRQVGSWHDDEAWFVWSANPWFVRGYYFAIGSGAGVLTFVHDHGSANSHGSFRVVLSV